MFNAAATTRCRVSGTKVTQAHGCFIAACTFAQDMSLTFALDFTNNSEFSVLVVFVYFNAFHFGNPIAFQILNLRCAEYDVVIRIKTLGHARRIVPHHVSPSILGTLALPPNHLQNRSHISMPFRCQLEHPIGLDRPCRKCNTLPSGSSCR